MRICLISTTIHVPTVLDLYRRSGPEVEMIIAGDRKSPHAEIRQYLDRIGGATYLSDSDQEKMGTRSSEIIGWNKIMRRNLALLEAIRRKPDVIVTIDDDNIPVDTNYFADVEAAFSHPFDGLAFTSAPGWFNAGELLTPRVFHRGFSYSKRQEPTLSARPITDAKVGVLAGLWLGDPDIDAMTRIHDGPIATGASMLAERLVVAAADSYSPFNTQNTAVLGELAPLLLCCVDIGRYDDIWASYVAERVFRETGHVVAYGKPFVWQERNAQNLWNNLKDEMFGMQATDAFVSTIEAAPIEGSTVVEKLRSVYRWIGKHDEFPKIVSELGEAWCADVEDALS